MAHHNAIVSEYVGVLVFLGRIPLKFTSLYAKFLCTYIICTQNYNQRFVVLWFELLQGGPGKTRLFTFIASL